MDLITSSSSVARAGDIYGRFRILGIYQEKNAYPKHALVECSCGSPPKFVSLKTLRSGESQSCGCLHKERITKHGAWSHPLFPVWSRMMSRCYNKKDKRYSRYGKRGIKVCDKWHDVNSFIADLSPSFKRGLTIDRINNDGDYEPSNCKWETRKKQNRNYSRNIYLTYNDEAMCLADWAIRLNICYGTLWDRMKQGWSTERMLSTPVLSKTNS